MSKKRNHVQHDKWVKRTGNPSKNGRYWCEIARDHYEEKVHHILLWNGKQWLQWKVSDEDMEWWDWFQLDANEHVVCYYLLPGEIYE